jgi:hypothetical protein
MNAATRLARSSSLGVPSPVRCSAPQGARRGLRHGVSSQLVLAGLQALQVRLGIVLPCR